MVEIRSIAATVRIHEDFCEDAPQDRLAYLEQLVMDSYKRRNGILPERFAGTES